MKANIVRGGIKRIGMGKKGYPWHLGTAVSVAEKEMRILVFYNHGNTCRLCGAVQFIEPSTRRLSVILKTTMGSRKGRSADFVNCGAEIASLKISN